MNNKPSNFFFIYLAVFVSVIAFSMIFPLLPIYGRYFHASELTIGLLAASFALAQLLCSPFWGALSDRLGRKPVILIGLAGLTGSFLIFAVSGNLLALFLARILQGAFSGAVMPSARAFIADVTSNEQRVGALGKLGAAQGLGLIMGPAIGGIFSTQGLAIPFFAAALAGAINFFFVFLLLPESLKEKVHATMHAKLAFHAFSRIARGLKDSLAPLFLLSFVWSFAISNNQVTIPLIGTDKFHIDTIAMGIGFTAMAITSSITQFFFIAPLSRFFGHVKIVSAGLLGMALAFFLIPLVPSNMFFLYGTLALVGFGSALARPVITALITEETTQPQGLTMGIAHSFESLGRLLGPLLGGFLFMFGSSTPFFFSAGIVALSVIFVFQKARLIRSART